MGEETNKTGTVAETVAANAPAAGAAAGAGQSERTFTQAELDQIVNERLGRERQKYSDYNAIKNELSTLKQQNAVRDIRVSVGKAKDVPWELLTGDTKEACEEQADAILAFAAGRKTKSTVPDGGETGHAGGGSTRDQFATWAEDVFGKVL